MTKKLSVILETVKTNKKDLNESFVIISDKAHNSLMKKSENSGIPLYILEEVYIRGYNYCTEETKKQKENYAFDRVNSFMSGGLAADIDNDLLKEESLHDWFAKSKSKDGKPGWVQIGGKHEGKPCARQPGQTTTPKCRPSHEASKMSKKEKEYAFRKKQEQDPNQPEKSGAAKPTYVKTYKEEIELEEKKDACYHKVKSRYRVFPSAYASGALVKCRKAGAKNWGSKTQNEEFMDESILNKPILTVKQIADKFDKDIEQIQSALEKGIGVEKEHTSSTRAAKRIALAHLSERPDYYEKLSKIEKQKINEMKVPRTFHIVRRIIRAKKRKYPDKRRSPIRNFIPKVKMVKPRIPKQKVKITKPRLTWDK